MHSWGSWSGTKQLEPWKKTPMRPPVDDWGSSSWTKQYKSLDMSRAPGCVLGYPCLKHGLILGLVPWWIGPRDMFWGNLVFDQVDLGVIPRCVGV